MEEFYLSRPALRNMVAKRRIDILKAVECVAEALAAGTPVAEAQVHATLLGVRALIEIAESVDDMPASECRYDGS